jgi:C-terminal processing protease CtpA/Prc
VKKNIFALSLLLQVCVSGSPGAGFAASPDREPAAPITLTGGINKTDAYSRAMKKLAAGIELNSDEYRSLNIGIIGCDTDRTYFTKLATVTSLYDGCPAKEAGIKLGDQEIQDEARTDDSGVDDETVPKWSFGCGVAGDPVDLTIKRRGKILHFHLIRMNIEDVPNLKLRHTYEQLVKLTGVNNGDVEIPKTMLDKITQGD